MHQPVIMPDGEAASEVGTSCASTIAEHSVFSSTDDGEEEPSSSLQLPEKDPRTYARQYQLDLCKQALEENIIVYLETGCGKTHIAVLLIYELRHLIRTPQRSVCIFLAPTVALVHQQARVIEETINFKVAIHCGSSKHLKTHRDWEKEIEQYEVLVMIPQILLHNLSHSFIKMESIALLIFDECHHAQIKSSHPYAEIMKVFYKTSDGKTPRIFGMTASPVVGKDDATQANLPKSINSLENLLDAKVYTVEDKEELERYVASPVIKIYKYDSLPNEMPCPYDTYRSKLEQMKRQCIAELGKSIDQKSLQTLRNAKKVLRRMHDNIIFSLKNLGLWGALQACRILLSNDHSEWNALIEAEGNNCDDTVCDRYLAQAANLFAADCTRGNMASDLSSVEILKEPFFSVKLLCLIGILSTCRTQPNMKCIIFVDRIVLARSLSYILQNLKLLTSWKCDFLVGVHSALKSMSRKTMNNILEKFREGKLNILVATKVGEEGLDIQTCCLVIRFDLPQTVSSFIQSRGRARMPQSEYAFLVDSGSQKDLDLIKSFRKDEDRMNMEISCRTSDETFVSLEEKVYRVDSSGACISSGYSISLLNHYCSKLPHDEYFVPKPNFFYFDDSGGTVCHIMLPSNAPIHQVVGSPQPSIEAAKKDACLKAIEHLHKLGAVNNFLLPEQEDIDESVMSSNSDCDEEEGSRGDLHEMLVPSLLKEPLISSENSQLNTYYLLFCPDPNDRIYKKFGLFVKEPLPLEAVEMELDLHLAHGRSVIVKLVPSKVSLFSKDEIMEAQNFQEMFLKFILDRSEFIHEFVSLGKITSCGSSPTFYLLLPIILHDCGNQVIVDWEIIRRCLSSPIFRSPTDVIDMGTCSSDTQLHLASGCRTTSDVENSIVYYSHHKKFYFIASIRLEKTGYSPYKGSNPPSHVEHLRTRFGIHLKYPYQPLLRAKPLFSLRNLLHNRKKEDSEPQELDEYFVDLVPELCELKIIGFSKDIGSSISLLPSIMHRLQNLLVAIELKHLLSASFPEGVEVSAHRVLEALTTEKCQERLSLERLEILGDAFLKFAVGRYLFLVHDTVDEGELTRRRSKAVNNSNLFKLACRANLQAYIRDQPFEPSQFFALGRPCLKICSKELEGTIHSDYVNRTEVRCSKGHHWLHKKTIADVVEALVGAFIVDSGFKAATSFLRWIGIKVDFEASQVINACQASCVYMPLSLYMDIVPLENHLDYSFRHRGLLLQAFVHPSYNKHGGGCYQRLEFLGDAVLDYLIISYLFSVYPKLTPGHLTDLKSALANNKAFANISVHRSLHEFLLSDSSILSEAIKDYADFVNTPVSERDPHEEPKCPKVLGDLMESCIGAIFLDSGFSLNLIWKLMLSFLDPIMNFTNVQLHPYRELQELCQSHNWDLQFPTRKRGKYFSVEAKVSGKDVLLSASASNLSKKEAISIASEHVLSKLKDEGHAPKSNYLEDALRSCRRMEPKLIGYDENPIDIIAADISEAAHLNMQDSNGSNFNIKTRSIRKMSSILPSCSGAVSRGKLCLSENAEGHPSETVAHPGSDTGSQITGVSGHHESARSRLYEICAANCWKPPLFECCHDEGPSHLRSFTYKVIVEIEAASYLMLECFGAPRMKKKEAAENAAEGAIWYLEQEGLLV